MNHNKFSSLYKAAVVTFFRYIIELEPAVYSQIGKRWVRIFLFLCRNYQSHSLSHMGPGVTFLFFGRVSSLDNEKVLYGVIVTSILFFVPLIFTLGANGIIVYIARTHARKRGVPSFKKVRCQSQRSHFSKQSGRYPFLDIGFVRCIGWGQNQNKKTWPRVEVEQLFWWQPFVAIGRNKFSNKH